MNADKASLGLMIGRQQNGAVLIVAMVFLLLITIVALAGSRRSTLELQMAGNSQLGAEYFEFANSVVDEVRAKNIFPDDNKVLCSAGATYTDCTQNSLSITKSYLSGVAAVVNYKIQKKDARSGASWVPEDDSTKVTQLSTSGTTTENAPPRLPFAVYSTRADIVGANNKSGAAAVEYGFMRFEPEGL